MNDLLFIWLSLSLSGSLVALTLILLKPILQRFSKTWQYYIWLLVILRLLIPFSPDFSIIGSLFQQGKTHFVLGYGAVEELPEVKGLDFAENQNRLDLENNTLQKFPAVVAGSSFVKSHLLGTIWLTTAIILLIRKMYGYEQFMKAVKRESKIASGGQLPAVLKEVSTTMGIKRGVVVCTNSLVRAPMLIGLTKPIIILPATAINKFELACIFRHELTHYRRKDLLYKWLVEITICLHWFNPIVCWVQKQINRSCEFSCDETVISCLSGTERQIYGETLLKSIVVSHFGRAGIIPLSLNEDGKLIKERLYGIMYYQRKSKSVGFMATLLTIVLLCGTIYAGAYTMSAAQIPNQQPQNKHIFLQSNTVATQTVVYEKVEIRQYEGENGHPYIHDIKTNNTTKKIMDCQYGMLAFDEEGNPVQIDWWSLDTELDNTWFYLNSADSTVIAAGETTTDNTDEVGGWSLNFFGEDSAVEDVAYVLYCDKEIIFEDGTVWKNPNFKKWLVAYEGKKVDVHILKSYYPYKQKIIF